MGYLVVFGLSIISCVLGFALELTQRNAQHLENGREPNAGVALLPEVVAIPAAYLGAAWGLNQWQPSVGFTVIAAYFCLSVAVRVVMLVKARAKLKGRASALQRADA